MPTSVGDHAPVPVWQAFGRRGFATYLLEELHDGCADLMAGGAPSSVSKLFYSRWVRVSRLG